MFQGKVNLSNSILIFLPLIVDSFFIKNVLSNNMITPADNENNT